MLGLYRIKSAAQASTYYKRDDYYLQEQGEWQGKLATKLGFTGTIEEATFESLINGKDPKGRFKIQAGGHSYKHSPGVDLTFSAPKSVSIAALVFDDKKVLEAHNKAVTNALSYIEDKYTDTRLKTKGKEIAEATGNMIAAKFQHITSRELDPQLHTHCVMMNMTQKANGKIQAMDYKRIYDNKLLLGQVYRNELARNLQLLNYQLVTDSKGFFELQAIDAKLNHEFSKRSEQIKIRTAELMLEYPHVNESKLKEQAALETRSNKQIVDTKELKQDWELRVAGLEFNQAEITDRLKQDDGKVQPVDKLTIKEVVASSITIATENQVIVKIEDILKVAAKLGVGDYTFIDLEKALAKNTSLVKLPDGMYTTKEIIALEQTIVDTVTQGKNQLTEILPLDKVQVEVARYELNKGFNMTNGQKEAVAHILTSLDKVIAIQGDAGTGKTTMLDVVKTIADKQQQEIIGLAFTGKAASEIEEASKIPAKTLAKFLSGEESLENKLVVVDEASMLSLKDLDALFKRCKSDTKVVLIGDTKQLQTIGQGKIFTSLQEKQIISTTRMGEVQRQQSDGYKQIVADLGNKKIEAAFDKLNNQKLITEVKDYAKRLRAITKQYMQNPNSSIVVTAINKDRRDLNKFIRAELLASNKIDDKKSKTFCVREVKSLIGVNKYYAQNYERGDILVANKADILGKSGAEARITAIDQQKHELEATNSKGQKYTIDLKQQGADLQVYTDTSISFAAGDKILFLKNDNKLKVKNGQTAYIQKLEDDGKLSLKMDNGRELTVNPKGEYNYLSYGYTLTDYKSQGQTAKHVIYHASTEAGVNYNQAYVGITRGKASVRIFTDDTTLLLKQVKQEQVKTTTLDYNLTEPNKLIEVSPLNQVITEDKIKQQAISPKINEKDVLSDKFNKQVESGKAKFKHREMEI